MRGSSRRRARVPSAPPDAAGQRPLIGTDDPDLLDDLLRLAAAAGTEVEVATDAAGVRARWTAAPLVVVGADLAADLAGTAPPRRSDVAVVSGAATEADVWRRAVGVGADHVVLLPDGERWLVDRLADVQEGPPRDGPVIAVVGGRGGAGASTLTAALAVVSARSGARTLLVDADPWGGGQDLLLGGEDEPGLRWSDLGGTRGRVAASALDHALPRLHDVAVLSWGRDGATSVPAEAVAALVDAGRRGFDRTFVDVARVGDAAAHAALARAVRTVLVVPAEVRAVAAAARVLQAVRQSTVDVRVVVRGSRGPEPTAVAEALGLPLAGVLPEEPGLAAAVDRGEPPAARPRTRLARSAARLLATLERGVA